MRVMIVEDQPILREGLRMMLEADGGVRVVTMASSAEEALEKLAGSSCEIILMDVTLPGRDGVWCTRTLRERGFRQPVIMVTSHECVDIARASLRAGANGYLYKTASVQELQRALWEVRRGGSYVQPTLLGRLVVQGV